MDIIISVAVGLGLSAACGFRVFVPMLALSIAGRTGHVVLDDHFAFLLSDMALIGLSVATLCEVAAYYIPWLDNMLDVLATPSAVVAGVLASGAMHSDMSPWLHWSIAAIGGGGAAATVQVGTAATRQISAVTTGGFGNPVVATGELFGSIVMAIMAILIPLIALALLVVVIALAFKKIRNTRRVKAKQRLAGTTT